MNSRNALAPDECLSEIQHEFRDKTCVIKWKWPRNPEINFIYIYRLKNHETFDVKELIKKEGKLYTKDEYKEFNGYYERNQEVGQYTYILYPGYLENGQVVLVEQTEGNTVTICTGKIKIGYKMKEKNKLFSNKKVVQIIIRPDVPIHKDILCYVKKEGGYPVNKQDGIIYPFQQDFKLGENVLPEIEVAKSEKIKVFFTDEKKYGVLYAIVPM